MSAALPSPDRGPRWPADDATMALPAVGAERGRHAARGRHAVQREPSRGWRIVREIVLIVGIAVLVSVLIRLFLAQAFYVPSASMEDTLRPGDRIIASKITTSISGVQRGEVVVFGDPGGWLSEPPPSETGVVAAVQSALTFLGLVPSDSGRDVVKRVIGVGGDRVACCSEDGRIVLNGVPLSEPYLKPGVPTDQVIFDVVVPDGGIFVMGDNRANSRDSRYHLDVNNGAVPQDNVVGRVVLVVWPFDRMAGVPIPSVFDQVAAATP